MRKMVSLTYWAYVKDKGKKVAESDKKTEKAANKEEKKRRLASMSPEQFEDYQMWRVVKKSRG